MEEMKCPHIRVDGFGFLPGDSRNVVRRYTLTNKNDATVRLITLGAGIQSIVVPNQNYDYADVVLGFDEVKGYLQNRYIGRIVGKLSDFHMETTVKIPETSCNYDIVNWDSYILGDQVVMTHVGDSYPGILMTQVKYTWTDENKLHIEICSRSTKSTPVNISSYCLFNLAGHGMGASELKNHIVTVNAEKCLQEDVLRRKPTGIIKTIENTPLDLRFPIRLNLKRLYRIPSGGYNHHFCIDNPDGPWCYRFHARVKHSGTGRILEVYSNHPTMKFYTGNHLPELERIKQLDLNGKIIKCEMDELEKKINGKGGMSYTRHGCFGLIPQGYPEPSTFKDFPSNILHPDKIYRHKITYDFKINT